MAREFYPDPSPASRDVDITFEQWLTSEGKNIPLE
jgi:hypothetical protein